MTVTSATQVESGPMLDAEGHGAAWRHGFASHDQFTGSLWICLPDDVSLVGAGEDAAVIVRRGHRIGEVHFSKKSEGVEIKVETSERPETVYYHLGYEME